MSFSSLGMLLVAAAAGAQQPGIPIRTVARSEAVSSTAFVQIDAVRELPNRRLLVNDVRGRRMVVFDPTLQQLTVLLDPASGSATSYPRAAPALIFSQADSTLFYNLDSQVLVMIAPDGTIGRTVAAPHAQTAPLLLGSESRPGVDQSGRLVYRGSSSMHVAVPGGPPAVIPSKPESAAVIRADFNTRTIDTIAWMTLPAGSPMLFAADPKTHKISARSMRTPVGPPFDDMAVLANGAVAIVRGQDYHIDWVLPDGTHRSTPKMPYDWRRLTDDEKQAKIDSARRIVDSVNAGRPLRPLFWPNADGRIDTILPVNDFVGVKDIPDYLPPIRQNAVKPDAEGNLWILPTASRQARGGLLYDVVNQNGEIFERVQLPPQCDVVGFGRGGAVYLSRRDAQGRQYNERTRIAR